MFIIKIELMIYTGLKFITFLENDTIKRLFYKIAVIKTHYSFD